VKTAVVQSEPHLIELITDGQVDYQIRQEIISHIFPETRTSSP